MCRRFCVVMLIASTGFLTSSAAGLNPPQESGDKTVPKKMQDETIHPADSGKAPKAGDPASASDSADADASWIQLFNGVDLEGWTPKIRGYELGENFANTFRVEDGALKVSYDGYDKFDNRFGHLFFREKFSHYILRVEYRFVGEQVPGGAGWAWRNSGVMLHGQDPETMGINQDFPVSIEAQFLGSGDPRTGPTLNLCTPGTHVEIAGELVKRHCTDSTSPDFPGDQWVTAVLEVHGNELIRHIIDDQVVLEYTHPQLDPGDKDALPLIVDEKVQLDGGTLSLQSESHPIEFRKVEIRLLDPEGKSPAGNSAGEKAPDNQQKEGDKSGGTTPGK